MICIFNNASLYTIYLAFLSLYIAQTTLTLIFSNWGKYFSLMAFNINKALHILKESTPIVLMIFTVHLYVRIDVFMIDYFQGKEKVAQYTASYNILDYLMVLSNATMAAIFPYFTNFTKSNRMKFKQLYKIIVQFFVTYLSPFALIVALYAPSIINILYGKDYIAASSSLSILMIATIFAWLNAPSGAIFIALKKQTLYLWGTLISLIINILGNLILIPLIGYNGAAISTVLTELVLVSFCFYHIYRLIGYIPIFCKLDPN